MLNQYKKRAAEILSDVISSNLNRHVSPNLLYSHFHLENVSKSSSKFGRLVLHLADILKHAVVSKRELEKLLISDLKPLSCYTNTLCIEFSATKLFRETLSLAYNENSNFGFTEKLKSKYVIDYGSPNIAKPLHPGHVRSLVLGSFLSKLLTLLGNDVCRICYYGDWGKQNALLLAGLEKKGVEDVYQLSNPELDLLDIYVNANANKSLQNRAQEILYSFEHDKGPSDLWRSCCKFSFDHCSKIFYRLGIHFDEIEWESQYFQDANRLCDELISKQNAVVLPNGSVEFRPNNGLPFILRKSDKTSLYIGRDICAFLSRFKRHNSKKFLYVVDSGQKSHFINLLNAVKTIQNGFHDCTIEEFVIDFGKISNLSTRRGPIVLLSDLLNEATDLAYRSAKKMKIIRPDIDQGAVAETIGKTHLILTDTLRPRRKSYKFSWTGLVHHHGLAYAAHYCHARLCSLERVNINVQSSNEPEITLLNDVKELRILQHLTAFPEVIERCRQNYEAYHLTQYIVNLVTLTNHALSTQMVKNSPDGYAAARLRLFKCCKNVLKKALSLYGIDALNEM